MAGGAAPLQSPPVPLRTLVVVNPASRGGATRKRFGALEPRIRAVLGDCDVEWTRGPRDAERIAREAVRAGVERVVVAGGDGTVSEVATGILAAGLGGYAEIAILPLGTGGDLRRTLGVPGEVEAALAAIAAGGARTIDAGRVSYTDRRGAPATVYFVNIASFGISGLTTELVNRAPKSFGGRVSFLIGTLRGIASYRAAAHPVELRVDGALAHRGPVALATAANGRWFGGGMHVAPEARPDDGLLDVVVIPGMSKWKLVKELPALYGGRHVHVPGVLSLRGKTLAAAPIDGGEPPWIEVDGEPLGRLPATFEIVPGALRLAGAPP
jgi:YegS/Rv2252/BmrU family lipid kinase